MLQREDWWILVHLTVLASLVIVTRQAWISFQPSQEVISRLAGADERSIALQAVAGGVGASITGASIIMGAVSAIAALRTDLDSNARLHLRFGAFLSGVSVLFGVLNATTLPQFSNTHNVALVPQIGTLLALQGYSMLLSMVSVLLGVWRIFSVRTPRTARRKAAS